MVGPRDRGLQAGAASVSIGEVAHALGVGGARGCAARAVQRGRPAVG